MLKAQMAKREVLNIICLSRQCWERTVPRETTYVKINVGAPLNKGVVDVSSIRDYIRARGGYQVQPASPNWELMPDGSIRRSRETIETARTARHLKDRDTNKSGTDNARPSLLSVPATSTTELPRHNG